MRITEACTSSQIKSLVAQMVFAFGPFATKDWVLSHIEPGVTQADAMSALMSAWLSVIA